MNLQALFCPNLDCPARGRQNEGNIHWHCPQTKRYRCDVCRTTFSARKGSLFYRLKTDPVVVMLVLKLMANGCPLEAVVKAYGFDRRTVQGWWQRAGVHCTAFHEQFVAKAHLDLQQVQADEIKVKARGGAWWMGLALMISTRLWLGGVVSARRDRSMIETLTHKSLRIRLAFGSRDHRWVARTPAPAAGLTDHVWTPEELLTYRLPLPPWQPPKRRGRPSKELQALIARWC